MSRKFEAHITCNRADSEVVKQTGEFYGWSFSAIDGDPIMGKQAYAYLTAYDTNGLVLLTRMNNIAGFLDLKGVYVLRRKVEEIVYDSKTGHNTLE